MTKNRVASVLIWFLLFQFAIGNNLQALASASAPGSAGIVPNGPLDLPLVPPPANPEERELEANLASDPHLNGLNSSYAALMAADPLTLPPAAPNVFGTAGRKHVVYSKDGSRAEQTIDLDRVSSENERVSLVDPNRELIFDYSFGLRGIGITKVRLQKDGTPVRQHSEYMNFVPTGAPIIDPNFIMMPTDEGVRGIMLSQEYETFCRGGAIAPVVIPNPPNGTIVGIRSLTRNATPSEMLVREGDGGNPNYHLEFDYEVTAAVNGISTPVKYRVTRTQVTRTFEAFEGAYLPFAQLANPDFQSLKEFDEAISAETPEMADYRQSQAAELDVEPAYPGQKVTLRAFAAANQLVTFENLAGIIRKNEKTNVSPLGALSQGPRDAFSTNVGPESNWVRSHQTIERGEEFNREFGLDKTWREISIESMKYSNEAKWRAAAEKEAKAERSFRYRWHQKVEKYMKSGRFRNTTILLAAAVGGYAVDKYFNNAQATQWATSMMLHVLDASTRVPGLRALTVDMQRAVSFYDSYGKAAMVAAGLGVILALRPLLYWAAGTIAKSRGESWDGVRAFFQYCYRYYVRVCNPAQKLAWKMFAENPYDWIDYNMDPMLIRSARSAARRAGSDSPLLDFQVDREATLKRRAMILAAFMVSEAYQRDGIAIDAISLLQAGEGRQVNEFVEMRKSAQENQVFIQAVMFNYKVLADMGDEAVVPIDTENFNKMVGVYHNLAQGFRKQMDSKTSRGRELITNLAERTWTIAKITTHNVLSYILYGAQGHIFYTTMKDAEIGQKAAITAKGNYEADFPLGAKLYAAVAPEAFAEIPVGGRAGWRVVADEGGQPFSWGGQGPVDAASINKESSTANTSIHLQVDPDHLNRPQSVREGLSAIWSEATDPGQQRNFTSNHAQFIRNLFPQFQVRWGLDFVPRLMGMTLKYFKLAPALHIATSTLGLTTLFLLNKTGFQLTADLKSLMIGYACVWPFVNTLISYMLNVATRNMIDLRQAHTDLVTGLEFNDLDLTRRGVGEMQTLYERDGHTLDPRFNLSPDQFTPELASEFRQYTFTHIPVPTEYSPRLYYFFNAIVGCGVSTILFNDLSKLLYDKDIHTPELLLRTAIGLVSTYVILTVAAPIEKAGWKLAGAIADKTKAGIAYCKRAWNLAF